MADHFGQKEYVGGIEVIPGSYRVVERSGYAGGGSLDPVTLALFAALGGAVLWTRRFA